MPKTTQTKLHSAADKPVSSVKVTIMRREFTIACSEDQTRSVVAAAAHLDQQMRKVSKGKVLAIERCAIIAALNISHEFLILQQENQPDHTINSRLENLHAKVDSVVTNLQKSNTG